MKGGHTGPVARADQNAYVRGEIDEEELRRFRARHDLPHCWSSLSRGKWAMRTSGGAATSTPAPACRAMRTPWILRNNVGAPT